MMKWINFLFIFLTLHTVVYSADMDPLDLEDHNGSLNLIQGNAPILINPLETQANPSLASSGFLNILRFEHILHITSFLSTPELGVLAQTCNALASDSKVAVLWRLAAQVQVSQDALSGISHPVLFQMSCLLQSPSALGVAALKFFQQPVHNIAALLQLSTIMHSINPKLLLSFYSSSYRSNPFFSKTFPLLQPHVYSLISEFPLIADSMLARGWFRDIVDLSQSECEWIVHYLKSQDNLEKSHMGPQDNIQPTEEVFNYILSYSIKLNKLNSLNGFINLIPDCLESLRTAIFIEYCAIKNALNSPPCEFIYNNISNKLLSDPSINESLILKIFLALRTLRNITSVNEFNFGFLSEVRNILTTSILSEDIVGAIEKLSLETLKAKQQILNETKRESKRKWETLITM